MSLPRHSESDPAYIRFGDAVAAIECDDPATFVSIARLLRHCLLPTARFNRDCLVSSLVVYSETDGSRTLRRDGEAMFRGSSIAELVERLLYEATIALATGSRSSLVLHAAGLALANTGIILCGESGAGKSTLAARLIPDGFAFLSDELLALNFAVTEMRGFPRPIALKDPHVWPPGIGTFEECFLGQNGTIYLDPERLRSGCVRDRAEPSLLVFPRYAAGASFSARKLTQAEAVYRLMHRLVNAGNLPERGFQEVTRLGRHVAAYAVTYPDASLTASWLRRVAAVDPDSRVRSPRSQ